MILHRTQLPIFRWAFAFALRWGLNLLRFRFVLDLRSLDTASKSLLLGRIRCEREFKAVLI